MKKLSLALTVVMGLFSSMAAQASDLFYSMAEHSHVIATKYMTAVGFMLFDGDGDHQATLASVTELLRKQNTAFTEFKAASDAKMAEIEKEGKASAAAVAAVDKITAELKALGDQIQEAKTRMDESEKKANRLGAARDGSKPEIEEHKQAFAKFLRKGDVTNLSELEKKAFQMGSDVDGGYLISEEMDTFIDRVASKQSSMRTLADVRTIGKASIEMRVKTSGVAARWVGEAETGGESTNPKYASIEIYANEMEIEPWAYNSALEDADYDIEADISTEAGIGFGEGEGVAFISGNGVKKPRGILAYPTVANANYVWGSVGYIASGAAGAFKASNPGDDIINLLHSLKAGYRNGAVLLMNDVTLGLVRQIKDGSGSFYLFNPDPTGKFGGYVLGVPVIVDDNMPDVAANSYSIAYANFNRAYRIVDRKGVALIRDNITTKGTTKFNFRRRVGGAIKQFEAIKLMKFAAS